MLCFLCLQLTKSEKEMVWPIASRGVCSVRLVKLVMVRLGRPFENSGTAPIAPRLGMLTPAAVAGSKPVLVK